MARSSIIDTQWGVAIAPARRDGRIVAETSEPDRTAKPVALPADLAPDLVEALRAGRDRGALLAPAARLGDGAALGPDRHQRHRLGQEPRLQPAGARRDRAAAEGAGALPLPDQGARPGPGAQARPAAAAGPARGDLRRRHAARGAPGDPPQIEPDPHQPRHAARRDPAQPPAVGRLPRQPRVGRRRRGAHLPRRLRLPRRQRAAAAAAGRPRLRRRPALPARLGDDRQPGGAGRSGWSAPSSS